MSILDLFCSVDDFWQHFAPNWHHDLLASGQRQRLRPTQMYPSELMTIVILFQQSYYRTFKAYYTEYVQRHLRSEFPTLVSYSRFVEVMPTILAPLLAYLHTQLGHCTGISFIDSTSLAVCHNARIHQHRVFAGRAARGKTSVGWFYGFKLHPVVNDQGELLALIIDDWVKKWVKRFRKAPPGNGSVLLGKPRGRTTSYSQTDHEVQAYHCYS